jgi:hypothetical protein
MDSISRSNLISFIKDFKLRRPDGITSFKALIIFRIAGIEQKIETEVLIIAGNQYEAIYFMDPEINKSELPDTFTSDMESFKYITDQCLQIKNDKNDLCLSIFPR